MEDAPRDRLVGFAAPCVGALPGRPRLAAPVVWCPKGLMQHVDVFVLDESSLDSGGERARRAPHHGAHDLWRLPTPLSPLRMPRHEGAAHAAEAEDGERRRGGR